MADPVLEARDEIRVAVVMYGGVSLAVYMNGITKELLNMVKSTSGAPEADQVSTDKTYRKLAQIISKEPGDDSNWSEKDPVTTRFIIDIISGTSAGGINGIFLAKALANNQDFNSLHDLWIDEGDLAKLINDKKSYQNVGSLPVESQPTSLLNSDRMFIKLYDAFKEMDKPSSDTSPYAKEIDLYVTTTDIRGQVVPLQLYDMFVDERRYKYDFHLRYAGKGSGQQERNDFEPSNNPFLAFAARCTSSFPFAFKPMEFENIQKLVAYRDPHFKIAPEQCSQWKKFLNEYEKRGDENKPREKRFFGDGGYLNNKPFGYVTEAVEHRTTACAVKHRFLFYIEPSPEHPEDDPPYPDAPDAVENATRALFTLPLDQTIREDLHKILNRNRDVRRIARIIEILESQRPTPQAETEKWLKELAPSPNPYELLKVSATTDGLAEILTRAMGFNEKSDEFYAIRCLVKAWREGLYGKSDDKFLQDPDIGYRLRRLRQFLLDFDIGYRLRRLRFLLRKISELSKLDNTAQETLKNVVGPEAVPKPLSTEWTSPFRDELLRAKGGVHLLAQKIQTRINELSARPWPSSGVDATGQPAPRNPL
ncbi:MAG TPA: patatin-like protein, partial [Terriglobia bacterium]|nr:patatin-like protein [Terriglobia bacterium]